MCDDDNASQPVEFAVTSSVGRRRRPVLKAFGQAIERARKQSKGGDGREFTQGQLAERVSEILAEDKLRSTGQSYIARIESGSISDPDPEILRGISKATGVPYLELVGDLVANKYSIDKDLLFPLYLEPKLFKDMPDWEKQIGHDELWIVTHDYKDGTLQRFRDAICTVLERGGKCTFFLGTAAYERFDDFRLRLLAEIGKPKEDLCLLAVLVSRDQIGHTYVFANPTSTRARDTSDRAAEGYMMLANEHGKRIVGLKMSDDDISSKVDVLFKLRNKAIQLLDKSGSSNVARLR
ncbi:MAG: helix-turn-helix domain-containing protein [Methylocella sp.]